MSTHHTANVLPCTCHAVWRSMLPQLQSHTLARKPINQTEAAGGCGDVTRELCCGYRLLGKRPEHIHDPYSLQHTVYSLASGVKSMK